MSQQVILYHFKTLGKGLLTAITIYFLVFFGASLIFNFTVADPTEAIGSVTGDEFIFVIFFFVAALAGYRGELRLMLQFGISRRTKWIATFISILVLSALVSTALIVVGILIKNMLPQINYNSFFTMIFPSSSRIVTWGLDIIMFLMFFYLGVLINLIYAHLNKLGAIIFSVGVPAGLYLLFFLDGIFWSRSIFLQLGEFFRWMGSSPLNTAMAFTVSTVIFLTLTFLLNRKVNLTDGVSGQLS